MLHLTDELATAMQQRAEAHLGQVQEAFFEQEYAGGDLEIEDPSIAPYCSCTTCDVREVLHAAMTRLTALGVCDYGLAPDDTDPQPLYRVLTEDQP